MVATGAESLRRSGRQPSSETQLVGRGFCLQKKSPGSMELVRSDSFDVFPAGLRVLVVDDDALCLKVVEHMLRRCNYTGAKCACT